MGASERQPLQLKKARRRNENADEWEKEGWTRLDTDHWVEFFKERWGEPGKALLRSEDRTIEVGQKHVWQDLDNLSETAGKLYRRESEYDRAYTRFRSAHKQEDIFGVVLTGSPGGGKSYCSVYVLLKRLAHKRPVLFTTKRGKVFYFDESGVRTCRVEKVSLPRCLQHLSRHPSKRVWSLIDPGVVKSPITGEITAPAVFHIVFASPDPTRYGHLLKQSTVYHIMQPWTVSEIHVYLSLIRKTSPKTGLPYTLEEARDIQREVGPCPRDIRTALRGGLESYKSNVHEIVARLDIAEINRVLLALPTLSYHNSDHIALLGRGGRDGEIDATSVQDDVAVVNFKTEHIAELVRRGFLQYELHSAAQLFSTCSTLVQGRTAALAGILFEGMNIALLCDLDSYKIDRSRGFSPMEEVQIKSADLPRRFEYHSVRSETTLLVDDDWTLRLTPETQTFSSRRAPSTLPATNPDTQKLALHRYTSFEDITELALGGCYVPREPNPHFDGFFLLHAGGQIELWVMQATVSRPHAAVPGSFETVQKVFAKANKTFNGKVLLKYLLVAPYQSGLSVVFNMAKEWSAVKTKFQVYLQFIEVAPNWTAEDVIRPCCSATY